MEEKEFYKEHPGLTGKEIVGDAYTSNDIHETQLDKQKVRDIINGYIGEYKKGIRVGSPINPMKLLKELGI